jgi:hypothetical protein
LLKLKKKRKEKAGVVAQGAGPEFKLHYWGKKQETKTW